MPCEVLRQCSATNPADIIIIICAVHDGTRRKEKSHFIFHVGIESILVVVHVELRAL